MSLSASTCLTYTGTTPLGQTLYVFSNVDAYSTYFTTIPLSAITGNNCPYLITGIPDGTTSIRLQDYATGCCVTIPIQCSDFCVTCDLNFTLLSATTVSQIVAGNLTGSCENITDYVVYWYGPNSSTQVGYISGSGNEFDYQFPHPLTGSSAIFAQGGTYTPIIDKIIISGITFSQTGGTGYYMANLDCFSPINVGSLRCDNGNQPTSAFTHFYSFSGASQGIESPPLQATFELSANTNYFAWRFRGFSVPDSLMFRYSGANYSTPLVVDNIIVGSNLPSTNLTWTNYLKSADTSSDVTRVICLTGLTRSPGNEKIFIDLIPSSGLTNWELSLGCVEIDCSKCIDDYLNEPYKIVLSSVTAQTYNNSDVLVSDFSASCYTKVLFQVSGCSSTAFTLTDYYTYLGNMPNAAMSSNAFGGSSSNPRLIPSASSFFGQQISDKLFFSGAECSQLGGSPSITSYTCASSDLSSTIFYSKYVSGSCPSCVGVVYFEFNQLDDLANYYNKYYEGLESSSSWYYSACTSESGVTFNNSGLFGPFSGGTFTGATTSPYENADYRYYRYMFLAIPTATGNTLCGQNTEGGGGGFTGNYASGAIQGLAIHPSSIVTTGITGSNYYLQIIMNKVSYGATFANCALNCTGTSSSIGFQAVVNFINNDSTGTSTNFSATTNTGSYFTNPYTRKSGSYMNCLNSTGNTFDGYYYHYDWIYNTLPFSSSTSPLYSLSAQTCTQYGVDAGSWYTQYLFYYQTRLINGESTDFEIWGSPISNGAYSGAPSTAIYQLALRYSGGTVTYTNPTYVIT
jgi:hypothetical protein